MWNKKPQKINTFSMQNPDRILDVHQELGCNCTTLVRPKSWMKKSMNKNYRSVKFLLKNIYLRKRKQLLSNSQYRVAAVLMVSRLDTQCGSGRLNGRTREGNVTGKKSGRKCRSGFKWQSGNTKGLEKWEVIINERLCSISQSGLEPEINKLHWSAIKE